MQNKITYKNNKIGVALLVIANLIGSNEAAVTPASAPTVQEHQGEGFVVRGIGGAYILQAPPGVDYSGTMELISKAIMDTPLLFDSTR